jgi:hypothetical protein
MNRMFKAALATVAAAGGIGSVGCMGKPSVQDRYAGYVDPCWPERYNYVARNEVLAPFAIHATNGMIVDHTLWNYYFDAGTDHLNAAGRDRLDYLARRRPAPESKVFLQTTRDLVFDPAAPDKFATARQDLDARRVQAVQQYLSASTAGRPLTFEVAVIDPSEHSFIATGPAYATRGWSYRFMSGVSGVRNTQQTGAGGMMMMAPVGTSPGTQSGGATGGTTLSGATGTGGGVAGPTGGPSDGGPSGSNNPQ